MGRGSVGVEMGEWWPLGAWTRLARKLLTLATWADLTGATRSASAVLCLRTQHGMFLKVQVPQGSNSGAVDKDG